MRSFVRAELISLAIAVTSLCPRRTRAQGAVVQRLVTVSNGPEWIRSASHSAAA